MERYYVIRGQYRHYLWGDKLKAFVLAVFAWVVVLSTIYWPAIGISEFFFADSGGYPWESYIFVYFVVFLMGGFMTLGFGTFVLRGMFDWIDDWYIVKSNEPQILPGERVRIRGAGHWWAIFKWGYDRSDRMLVFDGFEGRRYYRNHRYGWRYDDEYSRWQYPQAC